MCCSWACLEIHQEEKGWEKHTGPCKPPKDEGAHTGRINNQKTSPSGAVNKRRAEKGLLDGGGGVGGKCFQSVFAPSRRPATPSGSTRGRVRKVGASIISPKEFFIRQREEDNAGWPRNRFNFLNHNNMWAFERPRRGEKGG